MNATEVINVWPTIRNIILGHIDDRKRRELIVSLKSLLYKGLPVEAKPFGYTMFYLACAQGNKDLVDFLIDEGSDAHMRSKDHLLPIEIAAMMGEVI